MRGALSGSQLKPPALPGDVYSFVWLSGIAVPVARDEGFLSIADDAAKYVLVKYSQMAHNSNQTF